MSGIKIFGPSRKPFKYSSASTRYASLHSFMGDAEFNEVNEPPCANPGETGEDLEARFCSGVNRTDVPRMWGHPAVDRKIANKRPMLANEISAWRRNKGEPIK